MLPQQLLNRYIQALIQGAQSRGYDLDTIYRVLNLTAAPNSDKVPFDLESVEGLENFPRPNPILPKLHTGNSPVSPEDFLAIQRTIKLLLQDDFCGMTQTPCKVGVFMLMAELVLPSNTLEEALKKGSRFYDAVTDDVKIELHVLSDAVEIEVLLKNPERDIYNYFTEYWLLMWVHFSSWLIGEVIPVLRADFPHAAAVPLEEYSEVFGSACYFSQPKARLQFGRKYLSRRISRNLNELKDFVRTKRVDLVSQQGIDSSLNLRLKALLQYHFCETSQFISMDQAAEQYYMCSQTLRRRLEEERTSYRKIKDDIRKEYVLKWLANIDIPIRQVAEMSGFAEHNGLSRALKNWTGLTPTEYRRKIVKEHAA